MALRRLFTYLGAIFLMSHIILVNNAGAVQPVFDVSNYSTYRFVGNTEITCELGGAVTQTINAYSCVFGNTSSSSFVRLYDIRTQGSYSVKAGDLITFHIFIRNNTSVRYLPVLSYFGHTSNDFRILDFSQVTSDYLELYRELDGSYNTSTLGINLNDYVTNIEFYQVYAVTLEAINDYNGPVYLRGSNNDTAALFLFPESGFNNSYKVFLGNFQFRRLNESQENKEVEDKTNSAVQDSETQGSSSQTDAQSGSASLISTIGSAVSVITSASPTNCLLNGNMGNFDMGQIDLCANPVPAFVQIISSLILILITVPLCIVLFNRFIGLFRSFQG